MSKYKQLIKQFILFTFFCNVLDLAGFLDYFPFKDNCFGQKDKKIKEKMSNTHSTGFSAFVPANKSR